ncbi:flagellar protein FliT [Janthinobacterium sp.]|uniref:flagellar protein FliT n=1 Tax=Janthinobacterium sp. TaxID=1871054 RepID=UPI00338F82AA|nr:flagellar protein FliT [Janthinobacterium sp.]
MVVAARSSDWDGLDTLENQCASVASTAMTGKVPALAGASRLRKIDLLKQILANDREIRTITEPWMAQLSNAMPGSRARM